MERILQKSNYSPDKLGKAKGNFGTGTFILKSGYLKVPENKIQITFIKHHIYIWKWFE